jgi:hypothetical protein
MPTMIVMSGALSLSVTVMSSTMVIAPSRALPVASSISDDTRAAIELPSTVLSAQPVITRATSAEVKASPLFHVTPGRTLRVNSVASAFASQLSSSIPRSEPSGLYSTMYSSQPRVKFASSDQSKVRGSFIARVSICIRRVPPATAWASALAGACRPSSP